jgi:hypothetical protein
MPKKYQKGRAKSTSLLYNLKSYPAPDCATSRMDPMTQNTDVAIAIMIHHAKTIMTGSINLEILEIPLASSSW